MASTALTIEELTTLLALAEQHESLVTERQDPGESERH
jgi:hypothetical protein